MGQSKGRPAEQRSARRGRPTNSDRAKIDRAIFDAARNRFLACGYSNVQMSDVASEARVTKTTLYARYASKEALLQSVVREQMRKLEEATPIRPAPAQDSVIACLDWHVAVQVEGLLSSEVQDLTRLILGSDMLKVPFAAALHEFGFRRGIQRVVEDLRRIEGAPTRIVEQAEALSETLISGLIGWYACEWRVTGGSRDDLVAYGRKLARILVAGYD